MDLFPLLKNVRNMRIGNIYVANSNNNVSYSEFCQRQIKHLQRPLILSTYTPPREIILDVSYIKVI